ncbi:hypothetical protein HYS54_01505 [Candidatus Micrarchaeota archaeon]|nr:hypothetical protein [Candidatus Micrarchaeota archaeon]
MERGQSSLEYLIILVAVLASASFIILLLGGSFTPEVSASQIAACRQAASTCQSIKLANPSYDCIPFCVTQCSDAGGKDVVDRQTTANGGGSLGAGASCCAAGKPQGVYSGAPRC